MRSYTSGYIIMRVAEENDGYQHIFIYKNESVLKQDQAGIGWLDKNLFCNYQSLCQ